MPRRAPFGSEIKPTQEKSAAPMSRAEFFDTLERELQKFGKGSINIPLHFLKKRMLEHSPEDAIDFIERFPGGIYLAGLVFGDPAFWEKHPDLKERVRALTKDAAYKFPNSKAAHVAENVFNLDYTPERDEKYWAEYQREAESSFDTVNESEYSEALKLIDTYYSHQLALRIVGEPKNSDTRTPAEHIAWSLVSDRVQVMNRAIQTGDLLNIFATTFGSRVLPSDDDLKLQFADRVPSMRQFAIDEEKRRLMREYLSKAVQYDLLLPLEGRFIAPQEIERILEHLPNVDAGDERDILKRADVERWLPLDAMVQGKQAIARRELPQEIKSSLKKRGVPDDGYELTWDPITKQFAVDFKKDVAQAPTKPRVEKKYAPPDPNHFVFDTNYGTFEYHKHEGVSYGFIQFRMDRGLLQLRTKLDFNTFEVFYVDPDEPVVWLKEKNGKTLSAYQFGGESNEHQFFYGAVTNRSGIEIKMLGNARKKRFAQVEDQLILDLKTGEYKAVPHSDGIIIGAVGDYIFAEHNGAVKKFDINDWKHPINFFLGDKPSADKKVTPVFSDNRAVFLVMPTDLLDSHRYESFDETGNFLLVVGPNIEYVGFSQGKLIIVEMNADQSFKVSVEQEKGEPFKITTFPPIPKELDVQNKVDYFSKVYYSANTVGGKVQLLVNNVQQQTVLVGYERRGGIVWEYEQGAQYAECGGYAINTVMSWQVNDVQDVVRFQGVRGNNFLPDVLLDEAGQPFIYNSKTDHLTLIGNEEKHQLEVTVWRGTNFPTIAIQTSYPVPWDENEVVAPELNADEQEKLDLLNATMNPTDRRIDLLLEKYARPDLFPQTTEERETNIKEELFNSTRFIQRLRDMVKSAAGNLPLARSLFKTLAATSTNKNDLLSREIVDLMFPDLPALRAEAAVKNYAPSYSEYSLAPHENTELIGGKLNESESEKTNMFELREPYNGFIVQQRFVGTPNKSKKFQDMSSLYAVEPSVGLLQENTISIPVSKQSERVSLPFIAGGGVIPERVKARMSDGSWSEPLEIKTNLSAPYVQVPRGAVEVVYSVRYPSVPPAAPHIDSKTYDLFVRDWDRKKTGETSELKIPLAQLPADCVVFVRSIAELPPHERIKKIQEFVRANSFYDFDNDDVRDAKRNLSLTEQVRFMRSRVAQLSARSPQLAAALKGKTFAGICDDFAKLTAAMFDASGLVSGVSSGFLVSDNAKKVTSADAHAVAWAAFPGSKSGAAIIVDVDGTPAAGTPGHEAELHALQLPSLVEAEKNQETARVEESVTANKEFEKIVATLDAANPEKIKLLTNGELERAVNAVLSPAGTAPKDAIAIEHTLNVLLYSPVSVDRINWRSVTDRVGLLKFIDEELQRERSMHKQDFSRTLPGTRVMDSFLQFIDRYKRRFPNDPPEKVYEILEHVFDEIKNQMSVPEYRVATTVNTYLRAKKMLADRTR